METKKGKKLQEKTVSGTKKTKAKKKVRLPYGLIGRVILGTAAFAGFVVVAAAAPNVFQTLRIFERNHGRCYQRYRSPEVVRREIAKLVGKKFVVVFEKNGEQCIRLTEKGRQELLRYQLKEKSLEKRSWDGKWRLIIFDIEEKKRGLRDGLRQQMQAFGFEKLQDSVWAYPYECEQVVTLLKARYRVGKELLYIVAGDVEGDERLKKSFQLK